MSGLKVASKFLRHGPCEHCGGSDCSSIYDDGHQWCFTCNVYTPASDELENDNKASYVAATRQNVGTYQQVPTKRTTEFKMKTTRADYLPS